MCITTIANLMQNSTKEGASRQYFSRDREIVPYVDSHWEYLTTMPRRVTQSWHSTIHKTLMKEKGIFAKDIKMYHSKLKNKLSLFYSICRVDLRLPGTRTRNDGK